MLNTIINKNLMFLQKHGIEMGTDEDKDVYKYGLQLIYSYVINISIILSISACFHKLYQTSIMIFVFAILQAFGGGYHAKTKFKCLSLMIVGCIAGNMLINIISYYKVFMLISAIIVLTAVLLLGPVKNKNHPVSIKTYNRSKLIFRFIIFLNIFIILLSSILDMKNILSIVSTTIYLYFISLLITQIQIYKIFRNI